MRLGISKSLLIKTMIPSEIANKARQLQTSEDLLDLINQIRLSSGYKDIKKIGHRQLLLYCNPRSKVTRYKSFTIPKKSGGVRSISAPMPKLGAILWPVKEILSSLYEPQPCVMGFTPCRSIVDNAKLHLGQNYILNLDLKDFFFSIPQARVWKRLQIPPFNFPTEVANVIAGLCAIKTTIDGKEVCVLPQGAPTSPILTNIVCRNLDRKLTGIANKYYLRYSRYADDITFSSMHSALSLKGKVYREILDAIEEQGFTVNPAKTRLQKRGSRQEVTGLIISDKVNTPKKYVQELDLLLYVWEKFGYEKALARLVSDYKGIPGKTQRSLSLEHVIGGKLNYLKMVKGERDKVVIKYSTLYKKLLSRRHPEADGIVYLATYPLNEFEEQFGTSVIIVLENEKVSASFELGGRIRDIQLSNRAAGIFKKGKGSPHFDKLAVSLCQKEAILFWYCHTGAPKIAEPAKLAIPAHKLIDMWEQRGINYAIKAEESARKRSSQKNPFEQRILDLLQRESNQATDNQETLIELSDFLNQ